MQQINPLVQLQDWHNFVPALRQIAVKGKCIYAIRKAINEAEEQMRRRRGELHPTSRFIRKELRVMPLDQVRHRQSSLALEPIATTRLTPSSMHA